MVAGPPLKCTSAEDVYLLLKSSDFIAHDLDHAYDDCEDVTEESSKTAPSYHLVLKKYFSMPKSHEFRCFVREGRLQGMSTALRPQETLPTSAELNGSISHLATGQQLL